MFDLVFLQGDRLSRPDTAAPLQFSAPEASIAHAFPGGSEPATQETFGKTAAKSDPVTWEISDDERPHGLTHHAKEGYGRQSLSFNSISASASNRPENKQRSKLLTDKVCCIHGFHFILHISTFIAVHSVKFRKYFFISK